jgi:hypothetical protein
MISALILAISAAALIQFALAQWRAIWISAANQSVSETLRTETGLDADTLRDTDFPRLVSLYNEVCPDKKTSGSWLKEIALYYRIVAGLREASRKVMPSVSNWAASEMRTCSRYVAVVIDHHLSLNMDRLASARAS